MGKYTTIVAWDSLHLLAAGGEYPNPDPPHNPIASVFLSNDGGLSWSYKTRARHTGTNPFATFDTSIVYFTEGPNMFHKSHDKGFTMQPYNLPPDAFNPPYPEQAAFASDTNNITIVGLNGQIYRSFDGGKNWVKQNSGTTITLYSVNFVDSSHGWAGGSDGVILHTTNGGKSWVKQSLPINLNLQSNPNPSNSQITFGYTLPEVQHVSVFISDLTGRVLQQPISLLLEDKGFHSVQISISSLPVGAYICMLQTEKYSASLKFEVIH